MLLQVRKREKKKDQDKGGTGIRRNISFLSEVRGKKKGGRNLDVDVQGREEKRSWSSGGEKGIPVFEGERKKEKAKKKNGFGSWWDGMEGKGRGKKKKGTQHRRKGEEGVVHINSTGCWRGKGEEDETRAIVHLNQREGGKRGKRKFSEGKGGGSEPRKGVWIHAWESVSQKGGGKRKKKR